MSEVKEQSFKLPAFTVTILESISDGVFTVDRNWKISSFNRAAEEITGVSRTEAIGSLCSEVFRSNMCSSECALFETLQNGRPIINKFAYIIDAGGNRIPISVSTAVLRDERGNIVGGAETFRDLSELETLREELEGNCQAGELNSRSPLMQRIFQNLPAIAESSSTVLITGESGTGKEVAARSIHQLGPRREEPFLAVNCGALPDNLLESELFGYKAGAFTGAAKDKPGRFALAKGGTIFLDEIGELSPPLQVKLLRVLQDGTYEPLGSTSSETTAARVIVATNRDMREDVNEGRFRQDLYYRINIVSLEMPPLRQRKEDIPLLAEQFIKRFNKLQGKKVEGLSGGALPLLMAHDWPGNIRELENVIERAFILCRDGFIEVFHLPDELVGEKNREPDNNEDFHSARAAFDKRTIEAALENNNFNRSAAARELGIHKTTLFRRIRKLGIKLPERDGRSH